MLVPMPVFQIVCVCVREYERERTLKVDLPFKSLQLKSSKHFFSSQHIIPRAVWTPRQLYQPDSALCVCVCVCVCVFKELCIRLSLAAGSSPSPYFIVRL